jgi:hypothetical protein
MRQPAIRSLFEGSNVVNALLKYTFRDLADVSSLNPELIIYDDPVLEAREGKVTSIPFSLTEKQAGEIFRKIISDEALVAKIKEKLDEAKRVPQPTNITGAHPVDENLLEIKKIVRSQAPNAPTDVVHWFARLSYEMANVSG